MNPVGEKSGGKLLEIYNILLHEFGPRNWWPAKTRFEVIVGAILTQNTAWKNVEKAISNLSAKGVLSFKDIGDINEKDLAILIKPSGYFNQKAKKLKAFINFAVDQYGGSLSKMMREDPGVLRKKLLGVFGIGKETADSILLYAFDKPVFVVDIYTYRILSRHRLIPEEFSYDYIQDFFTKTLPEDVYIYKEYHALLVCLGNKFCRSKPFCEQCPLRYLNGKPKNSYKL
jgi:endonuclease-3 related protein